MSKKNIGGKAIRKPWSLAEIEELQNRAYQAGLDQGEINAAKVARLRGCGHECLACKVSDLEARLYRAENPERRSHRR